MIAMINQRYINVFNGDKVTVESMYKNHSAQYVNYRKDVPVILDETRRQYEFSRPVHAFLKAFKPIINENKYSVPGTKYPVPSTQYSVLTTKY